MKNLYTLLAAVALVASAAAAVPAQAATELQTPPPETVWAFFEALPDAVLPAGINTRAERVKFHEDYESMVVDPSTFDEEDEEFYYGDYLEEISFQVFWNPSILMPEWIGDDGDEFGESDGPVPSIELAVYQGSDPDRIFGLLEVFEYIPVRGYKKTGEHAYWYSVSKKTVTPVALPLDVAYTDDDITEDGMIFYNENELYWVMRDRLMEWLEEPDRITIILNSIGATTVSYTWNGTKFVRDRDYNPLLVYSGGLGQIEFGKSIPFNIHGYNAFWLDTDEDNVRAWKYVKEGDDESNPRFAIYSYGSGMITVDAIDIFYPNYKLFEKIHVGMTASEAMEILKDYYTWDEEGRDPYISEFDGKAWIFSGHDDPYSLGLDPKNVKNGKPTANARIELIRIAPAVG